jgi:hypothetical protein
MMALILAAARDVTGAPSMIGVRVFLGVCFIVVTSAAFYFIRNRKRIFGGRGGDIAVDSPAAGNLRMWMVILVLLHAAAILLITMFEI